jgi:phosphoribosylformylglycinamidine synthase I
MPTALIITTAGINCDLELARSFELAGATPRFMHLNELMAEPSRMDAFDLIGLPGGFAHGDAVAAGRIAAQLMRQRLYPAFLRALQRGVPMIAPCNGFQMAAQIGLLPGPAPGEEWPDAPPRPSIVLAPNASARFIDRWVRVEFPSRTRCIWTQGIDADDAVRLLPIAHAEGRFIPASGELLERLDSNRQIAVRYAADDNPNGSTGNVAGICDPSGLVLGLMPHPERYTRWTQHPWWTRLGDDLRRGDTPGLRMFRNAVAHAAQVAAV